jgi:hypothetical protein
MEVTKNRSSSGSMKLPLDGRALGMFCVIMKPMLVTHLESNLAPISRLTTLMKHFHVETQAPCMICTTTRSHNYVLAMKAMITNRAKGDSNRLKLC